MTTQQTIDLDKGSFGIKNLVIVTSDNWVSYSDLLECVKNNDLSNATISHALSQHKKEETKYGLLFLNLRDRASQHLYSKIMHRYQMSDDTYPLYIIDSFEATPFHPIIPLLT